MRTAKRVVKMSIINPNRRGWGINSSIDVNVRIIAVRAMKVISIGREGHYLRHQSSPLNSGTILYYRLIQVAVRIIVIIRAVGRFIYCHFSMILRVLAKRDETP